MAIIRNLVVKISADISSLSKGLQNASKSLAKVSQSFTKIGTTLTASVTLPLVALGASIVKTSASFEQSMANAASVAGATGDEFERMIDIAREMGAKTIFSASEAADALYYMASAGYKVDQMAASIEATLNLASATQYDLAATTDIVIASLNQFSLEASSAERVTNVFAAAIGNSMATMDKLGNSMGYVGPVANSLGYQIEETVAALSILYNAGYDGSTAGTTLRQALVSLMNPTSAALAVFDELGLSFDELNPATNDFATIVDRLGEASMNTSQAMQVFGARGGPGMLALMNKGGKAIRDMTESITGTNKATDMAAIQINTLTGEWKLLTSELEEISIAFGDVLIPIIREFISKYITPLTRRLMGLSNAQKKQVVQIALIAAAMGPLFLIIGKLINSFSILLKIVPLIFSKVGLIVAVIALVIASFIHLYKTNDNFKKQIINIWEKIKNGVIKALNKLKEWWSENGQKIKKAISKKFEFIANFILKTFDKIYKKVKIVWPYIKEIIIGVFTALSIFWEKYGEKTKRAILIAFTKIREIVRTTLGAILIISKKILSKVKVIVNDTISGVQNTLIKDGKSIFTFFKDLITLTVNIVRKLFEVFLSAVSKLVKKIEPIWTKLKYTFSLLWETIKDVYKTIKPILAVLGAIFLVLFSVISGVINGSISMLAPLAEAVISAVNVILEVIRAVCALLRGDFSQAWEHIKNVGVNVWETLKQSGLAFYEFFKGIIESFLAFFNAFKDKIGEFLNSFWQAVVTWFEKIKAGLVEFGNWIYGWVSPLFSKIVAFFKDFADRISKTFKTCVESISNFFVGLHNGVKNTLEKIWTVFDKLFNDIKNFFEDLISKAFDWGKNLIVSIAKGIESSIDTVIEQVNSAGQAIADFLGFGSPTKKGPGREADKWIPNLMEMMSQGVYMEMPKIEAAAMQIASTLSLSTNSRRGMVTTGSSPFGDLLNGLLNASSSGLSSKSAAGDIILQIDGQNLARIMLPKLNKEYKRNGIILREV